MVEEIRGSWVVKFPKDRKSWVWPIKWRRVPALINNSALNIAWVSKWKKVKLGSPRASLIIITPSWLSVERAIIFFVSDSVMAAIPAIVKVQVAENSKVE